MTNTRIVIWLGLFSTAGIAVWLAWSPAAGSVVPAPRQALPASTFTSPGTFVADVDPAPRPAEREAVPSPAPAPGPSIAARPHHLRGRLTLDTGSVVPDALVLLGPRETKTEADGAFTFATEGLAADVDLVAIVQGHQPAVVNAVLTTPQAQRGERIEVVLPGPALSIAGTLYDGDGSPGEGWMLELSDGTRTAIGAFPPLTAEDLAAGAVRGGADRQGMPADAASPNRQRVAAHGGFRVGGLRAGRSYLLRAWNELTLEDVRSEAIPAGTERYVFRVSSASRRELVWGHVVDRRGTPLEGVRVRLTMRVHSGDSTTSYQTGQEQTTGSDGAFEFTSVPRRDLLLRFTASHVASLYREFPADEAGVGLRVELSTLCALRFESLPGLAAPDALRALDASGAALRMDQEVSPGVTRGGYQLELAEGPSATIRVADAAVVLVLLKESVELRRVPISLSRADTLLVRG